MQAARDRSPRAQLLAAAAQPRRRRCCLALPSWAFRQPGSASASLHARWTRSLHWPLHAANTQSQASSTASCQMREPRTLDEVLALGRDGHARRVRDLALHHLLGQLRAEQVRAQPADARAGVSRAGKAPGGGSSGPHTSACTQARAHRPGLASPAQPAGTRLGVCRIEGVVAVHHGVQDDACGTGGKWVARHGAGSLSGRPAEALALTGGAPAPTVPTAPPVRWQQAGPPPAAPLQTPLCQYTVRTAGPDVRLLGVVLGVYEDDLAGAGRGLGWRHSGA